MYDFRRVQQGDPGDHLLAWWRSLDTSRADRARLRTASVESAQILGAFHELVARLEASSVAQHVLLARIAIVSSHVREVELNVSFGAQLAAPKGSPRVPPVRGDNAPTFSELRFRRLLSSGEAGLHKRLVTAVRHLGGRSNLLDIANALAVWPEAKLRWARHYFASTTPHHTTENSS